MLDEHGGTTMGGTVAVADEEVFAIEVVGGAVAGGFPFFFVTFQEERSATEEHVLALAVEIGATDCLASSYSHAIVALGTTTAVVPGHEEIVVTVMMKDEGRLDGVASCKA